MKKAFYLLNICLFGAGGILAQDRVVEQTLIKDFGNYSRKITTDSDEAQLWFNQGIQLMYGFNHDEAIRSFHKAAELDPDAAMPWWGIAYSHGININDPAMSDERSRLAREAVDNALARLDDESPVEVAMVIAVSSRYEYPAPEDRKPLDLAWANAMQAVYKAFPKDPEVAVIFADSLMNLQPWNYWAKDGKPLGRIDEIVSALESTLRKNPYHPGANHLYIHAVEASIDPDRAEDAADRLVSLVPGSGHLVHMPSHIYVRVGRYADAVVSNKDAVQADRSYFTNAPEPGLYAIYYAHNLHFLAYAAMMSGNYAQALEAAENLEKEIPETALKAYAGLIDGVMASNFHVMIRFGKWEQVLEEPGYPEYRYMSNAVRLYARSIACSALGRTEQARDELEAFEAAIAEVPEDWYVFNNKVGDVLPIARAMVKGELWFREGNYEKAYAKLREGIEAEDNLVYDEPPGWMLPVRHALGALLMAQGHYREAENVYREDLTRNRNNGWGLLGLKNSLEKQGKTQEAAQLEEALAKAWKASDTKATSSCFCEPGRAMAAHR